MSSSSNAISVDDPPKIDRRQTQDGKNTLGSIREAAKLDAVAEQRKKNPPPNDKNANGEGGSGGYNNPPKDTTEKVEDTRQS